MVTYPSTVVVCLIPDVMARGAATWTGAPEGLEVRLRHLALVLMLQRVLHHGAVTAGTTRQESVKYSSNIEIRLLKLTAG